MATVTSRVKSIKQPRGGYLPISFFKEIKLDDKHELNANENVHPTLIGTAVDYLTRYMISNDKKQAFSISLKGARNAGLDLEAKMFLSMIKGLGRDSITSALNLVQFDQFYRTSFSGDDLCLEEILPNIETINNIKIMVNRTLNVFNKNSSEVLFNITFDGGYTRTISNGDADFIIKDTIWDIKVLKNNITTIHTLQLLVYYVMGMHSKNNYFKSIKNLGIFNPRKNVIYLCSIENISQDLITLVEDEIICY